MQIHGGYEGYVRNLTDAFYGQLHVGWCKPSFQMVKIDNERYYLNFPFLIFCSYFEDTGTKYLFQIFGSKDWPAAEILSTSVRALPIPNISGQGIVCLGDIREHTLTAHCTRFWNSKFTLTDIDYYLFGIQQLAKLMNGNKVYSMYAQAEENKTLMLGDELGKLNDLLLMKDKVRI